MIIVGLGNPGKEYANTPHNVGFMAVDEIAKNNNIEFKLSKKHNAMIGEGIISGEQSYLIKPLTYMNLSGNAVRSFVEYYNIDVESILIIYDDMDLPLGNLRIRKSGSSGGHKGMKSIIENLGTSNLKRIRVGVGHPETKNEVVDYVLHQLSKREQETLLHSIQLIPEMIEMCVAHNFEYMMNNYNGSK